MHDKATAAGLFMIFFNRQGYERLRDATIVELSSASEAEMAARVAKPFAQQKKEDDDKRITNFRRDVIGSLIATVASALVALGLAAALGRVSLSLPVDWAKVMVGVGTALMAWPTWLMLANPMESNKGWWLDELLRPYFLK